MVKDPIMFSSLDDLEIPKGLFPEMETLFIRRLAFRIVSKTSGTSIEEITVYFTVFNTLKDAFDVNDSHPEYEKITNIKSVILNRFKSQSLTPFVIPDKNNTDEELALFSVIKAINDNKSDLFPEIIGTSNLLEQLSPSFEINDKFISAIALYFYVLALEHAKDVAKNDETKAPYYRLGKINKYQYPKK